MDNINKKRYCLDFCGLVSIGIFSFGYIIFNRSFAELNVQLPFLDFPIFIGEMLLFLCLCLFLNKGDLRINKKSFWIIAYFVFVIVKALRGYSKFGPLAFRNAALFYYPVFIIFVNSFFQKDFFKNKINILYSAMIILLLSRGGFGEYWLFTCFTLAFIFSYAYPNKTLKYLALAALFWATPYKLLFATSRMMMVANFSTFIYVIIGLYCILRIRKAIKWIVIILGMFLIVGMFLKFSDRNALTTLVRADKILEAFRTQDMRSKVILEEIQREGGWGDFEKGMGYGQTRQVRIYNPEWFRRTERLEKDMPAKIKRGKILKKLNKGLIRLSESTVKAQEDDALDGEMNLDQLAEIEDGRMLDRKMNLDQLAEIEDGRMLDGEMSVQESSKVETINLERDLGPAYGNAAFRLFIWRDMFAELIKEKQIFGFNFGKPFRSITLEALMWGYGDWHRDGWIGAHNSFVHIIYRSGIIGLFLIGFILFALFRMVIKSIRCHSLIGILLCGIIINWFIAANFLLILELPYTAIPIWSIFGLTYAYVGKLETTTVMVETK